jgi:hypothetical protein
MSTFCVGVFHASHLGCPSKQFVSVVSLLNRNREFDVPIEPKQTVDPPKQFKREYIYCFGLFRYVTKQICLFRLFQYRFETTKQTEMFCFWFHETNRNKRETDLVSVCFGSNRNLFLFVPRTPYSHPPPDYFSGGFSP